MVITETATMIGYTKSSSTFNDTPKAAIIKANSPICAKLKPDCIDVLSGCPDNRTPNEEKKAFPTIVTNVIKITGNHIVHQQAVSIVEHQ